MLTRLQKLLAYHMQAAINSLIDLCRQPLATAMTVIVIAITLTLPALLWVLTDNITEFTKDWERGGHISLYLDMHLPQSDSLSLLNTVQHIAGVGSAVLKTSEQGLLELQREEGMQDLMSDLPENPLPDVIDVIPSPNLNTPAELKALHARLKALPGVDDAQLDVEWVSRLHALLNISKNFTNGLIILLALTVILIIGNTLRLVINKRQEEVQVLKLIGASEQYIMRPFLYSGLWYGFGGALLALIFVSLFMLSLGLAVKELASAFQVHVSWFGLSFRQVCGLIVCSTFLGWLGACFSVKRQLAQISPAGI